MIHREVFACNDGPYGQKTDLGWGIVGIVNPSSCEDDQFGTSHHVVCREVPQTLASEPNLKVTPVLFSFQTSIKEVITGDVLRLRNLTSKMSLQAVKTGGFFQFYQMVLAFKGQLCNATSLL